MLCTDVGDQAMKRGRGQDRDRLVSALCVPPSTHSSINGP
jgi:hypothetical protein